MKRIVLVIMLMALEASAGPFKETLAKPDIEAIVKAIQAALPKVDQAAVKQCQPYLDAYNKDPEGSLDKVGAGAACFRAAGSIASAIQLWRTVETYDGDATRKRDAIRGLASAYEAAADFSQAAAYAEKYVAEYGRDKDAPDLLSRAICIRRQLGDAEAAERDVKRWRGTLKTKIDPDTLCDHLRPIAMPAKAP